MAPSEVRCCDAILYINLQFGDGVKQALQHVLTPIELGNLFGASKCTLEVDALVVVFGRRSKHVTHHENHKCYLEAVLLQLA